jgi:ABC-type uncharacterized transport system permease subunit
VLALLATGIAFGAPLALGAAAAVVGGGAGPLPLALEGVIVGSALAASIVASATVESLPDHNLVVGSLAGVGFGSLLAASLHRRLDGRDRGAVARALVVDATALAGAAVLYVLVFGIDSKLNDPGRARPAHLGGLGDVPVLGPLLGRQSLLVYAALALAALGPAAARIRRRGARAAVGGGLAGLAGACYPLGLAGRFDLGVVAGRGLVALAIVALAGANRAGILAAAWGLGIADALDRGGASTPFVTLAPFALAAAALVVAARRASLGDAVPGTEAT